MVGKQTMIKIGFSVDTEIGADGKRDVQVHMTVDDMDRVDGGLVRVAEVLEKTLLATSKIVLTNHPDDEHKSHASRIVEFLSH